MEYIAALDLGTSKMLAAAASKSNRDEIIATEKIASNDSIRRGLIGNAEKASLQLSLLIRNFNNRLKPNPGVKKVYVGIGGQSLHTKELTIQQEVNGEVNFKMIDAIENQCATYSEEHFELLSYSILEYYLDGRPEPFPEGSECQKITAKYQLILGHPFVKSELEKLIAKAGLEIAGFEISPLATAEVVLTNREKKAGCALIELGAGVTYLSIYKDGLLRYLVTIPLGGNVITKDICDLSKTEAEAEELKIKEGDVLAENEEDKLNQIIEARVNEIITNVMEQIKQSGYESTLSEGIVITGGGSLLKNIAEFISQKAKMPVRRASVQDPGQACVLGLLKLGKENCAKELPKVETQIVEPPQTELKDMFGNPVTPPAKHGSKGSKTSKEPKNGNFIGNIFRKGADILFSEGDATTQNNS